jgi:two-component system chemotaxis response regulator CheY
MSPKRILYVEDDAVNRLLMKAFLAGTEIELVEAVDGQQGLDILESAQFDVVFMDVRMPRMDGMTALRQLRARQDETPVIVVTADALEEVRDEGLALGANGVLFKPFSAKQLFSSLANVLVHTTSRRAA